MELSSPPSSPPPSAPNTPRQPAVPLAEPSSIKMEPTSSDLGRALAAESTTDTPTSECGTSHVRTASTSTPTVQRTSRRRMMPARLSQVSSLLAGSMLEEELLMLEPSSPSSSSFNNKANASDAARNSDGSSHNPDYRWCIHYGLYCCTLFRPSSSVPRRLSARVACHRPQHVGRPTIKQEQDANAHLYLQHQRRIRTTKWESSRPGTIKPLPALSSPH